MFRRDVRWLGVVALCAAALVGAGCGSDSGSDSTSGDSGGGAAKASGKVAIVMTRPADSAFGKPATDAAKEIESKYGYQVDVQGGLAANAVQRTIEGYATRGYKLVIIHGAEMQQQAQQVAPQFPDVKFVVVNGNAEAPPNLSSATYVWEESGFLAGLVGGVTTGSNKTGTLSSIKIPPIEGLYYGFQQGVKETNPKASTVNSYMGTNVPDTGLSANLTSAQADRGIDVVFTVATGADPGVFRAAGQKKINVIGYGTDETNLGPKVILTSSLVDYEGTIVRMAGLFKDGTLEPKVYEYGFKDNAFSLAPLVNMPKDQADKITELAEKAKAGEFQIKRLGQ
jgi:basic membrane protein A